MNLKSFPHLTEEADQEVKTNVPTTNLIQDLPISETQIQMTTPDWRSWPPCTPQNKALKAMIFKVYSPKFKLVKGNRKG